MKSTPYITVYCIAIFEEGIESELQKALSQYVTKRWSTASVTMISSRPYWKIDGEQAILYGISNSKKILVKDFIDMFNLSWRYSVSRVYSVDYNYSYDNESAIWNKNDTASNIFLLPNVNWAHVYTCARKEDAIITHDSE